MEAEVRKVRMIRPGPSRKIFRGPKLKGKIYQRQGDQHHSDNSNDPAMKERRRQSPTPGRLDPAEPSGIRPGRSSPRLPLQDIDQNRGGRAAVLGSVIDPRQHNDGSHGGGVESDRKQERHGPHRANAGRTPTSVPMRNSHKTIEEVHGLKSYGNPIIK